MNCRTRREWSFAAFGVASMIAASCGPKVSVTAPSGVTLTVGEDDPICVASAADGQYETRAYQGSGAKVTARTADALRQRYGNVVVIGAGDLRQLRTNCQSHDGRFLLVPVIIHWEDRAAEWSGKPDRMRVQLTLYDMANGSTARSVSVEAQSTFGSGTFAGWGNRPPEALLNEDFDRVAVELLSP